jgi:hypothetical protein
MDGGFWPMIIYGLAALLAIQGLLALTEQRRRLRLKELIDEELERRLAAKREQLAQQSDDAGRAAAR